MKISNLFLVSAVTLGLGLTACNKKENVNVEGQPESTVSVRVIPSTNRPVSKSTGDLSGDGILANGLAAESAIKTLEVYVFAGETPDGYKKETGEDVSQVLDIQTHKGTRTIVVVANASIGEVTNKTELLAKTKDIPVSIGNGLPMTSEAIEVTLNAGKNQYGFSANTGHYDGTAHQISPNDPLKIVRVNARVAIVCATLNLDEAEKVLFDNLRNVQIAMFNVPKTSKLFGDPLAMNADYLFGKTWPSSANSYQVGTETAEFSDETITFPITAAKAPYYYVTENTATDKDQQMFIVLRGKTYKGDTPIVADGYFTDSEGYTYYPIWVNATKAGYTYTDNNNTGDSKIRRNTQYNISLTIKKKGNPSIDDAEEAQLDVNISVKPWEVVSQKVEW